MLIPHQIFPQVKYTANTVNVQFFLLHWYTIQSLMYFLLLVIRIYNNVDIPEKYGPLWGLWEVSHPVCVSHCWNNKTSKCMLHAETSVTLGSWTVRDQTIEKIRATPTFHRHIPSRWRPSLITSKVIKEQTSFLALPAPSTNRCHHLNAWIFTMPTNYLIYYNTTSES